VKIYAISDQHGHLGPDIPECDLLIVAGDVAPSWHGPRNPGAERQRQDLWMVNWFAWIKRQPMKAWYACWGNHDYASPIKGFCDGPIEHNLLKLWFSPWSNEFCRWNWMKQPEELGEYYKQIPYGTDIIVSHQPPYGYGDLLAPFMRRGGEDPHVGSKELLETIKRIQPKAVVCGHIHDGHGIYKLNDDTTIYNVAVVDESYWLVHSATEIVL